MTITTQVDTTALDAWLAEHLFDGSPLDCTAPGHEGSQCWSIPTGPTHLAVIGYGPAPAYSTTGGGMLMVLEAMRERGWSRAIYEAPIGEVVEFARTGDKGEHLAYRAADELLPTAVGLAAKAALEAGDV